MRQLHCKCKCRINVVTPLYKIVYLMWRFNIHEITFIRHFGCCSKCLLSIPLLALASMLIKHYLDPINPGFPNHGSRPKIGSRRALLWVSGTIMGRMGRRLYADHWSAIKKFFFSKKKTSSNSFGWPFFFFQKTELIFRGDSFGEVLFFLEKTELFFITELFITGDFFFI